MKITAIVDINIGVFDTLSEKQIELLRRKIASSVTEDLLKKDVFKERIEINPVNGIASMQTSFFALSEGDMNRLSELIDKYPELDAIIRSIAK
jgi:hypothetical protein